MIPSLIKLTPLSPWNVLPPGIHPATLDEIASVFGSTGHRRNLLQGFVRAAINLQSAGCSTVYLDGSFVTAKNHPGDFDGCWDPIGVAGVKLDSVLLTFKNGRAAQKAKYGGELFISSGIEQKSQRTFLEYFQIDKFSGQQKGILKIQLTGTSLLKAQP